MSKIDVKIFIDNLIIINEFCFQGPPQPGQPFKFTVIESCDRIKEEFNFLQAQYHRWIFILIIYFIKIIIN